MTENSLTPSESRAIKEDISQFLQNHFPQIRTHGGQASIKTINRSHVEIRLSGACDGCKLTPMTVEAIEDRLPKYVTDIDSVSVTTGTPTDKPV